MVVFFWKKKSYKYQKNCNDPYAREGKTKPSTIVQESATDKTPQTQDEVVDTEDEEPKTKEVAIPTFPWTEDEIKAYILNGIKKYRFTVKGTVKPSTSVKMT